MSLMIDSRCRPGAVDLAEPPGLLRAWPGAVQQVGEADDGIHRRADLVAHVGQEGALGLVGGFGRAVAPRQFGSVRS
jgi:hypothetical protein